MILVFEWLSRCILLGLIVLSIWSIKLILDRWNYLKTRKINFSFYKSKISADGNAQAFVSEIQKQEPALYESLQEMNRFVERDQQEQVFSTFLKNEQGVGKEGLSVLGTLGSTSPFIGLLGTVMGIIVSFGKLSEGGGGTNEVMFSLAEALILTAVGLMVAIPAVIAFNYFNRQVQDRLEKLESLKDQYLLYARK